MKKISFVLRVVLLLAIISSGYFFLYLKPQKAKSLKYASHYTNLIENRNAYINLAKLNVNDPGFDFTKANLIDIVKKTNTQAINNSLTNEEKEILIKQNEILEKVFATSSYEEGVVILKSGESVKLIKEETILIDKYRLQ